MGRRGAIRLFCKKVPLIIKVIVEKDQLMSKLLDFPARLSAFTIITNLIGFTLISPSQIRCHGL